MQFKVEDCKNLCRFAIGLSKQEALPSVIISFQILNFLMRKIDKSIQFIFHQGNFITTI